MTDELLGVTTCPTCKKRFRVSKKYESLIGKEIKCQKCHRPFVVELETPAPIEQAAMANTVVASTNGQVLATSETDEQPVSRPIRRTKVQIRKAAYKRIRKAFGPFLKRLEAITCTDGTTEETVRIWCVEILKTALGYTDQDLGLELPALGDRIDIAVKDGENVKLIIECKRPGTLPEIGRRAAVKYAICKSADWAVLTNGQTWELHRVIPVSGQDPRVVEVFNISLLDDDEDVPLVVEIGW